MWRATNALLFGQDNYEECVLPYLLSHKINTLAIGEEEDYYGKPIYHLHVDGKPGRLNDKDQMQSRRCMSIVLTPHTAL